MPTCWAGVMGSVALKPSPQGEFPVQEGLRGLRCGIGQGETHSRWRITEQGVSTVDSFVVTDDGVKLHYEVFGAGNRIILCAQASFFYPHGIHQALASRGYHVYCITLRGFAPSSYVTEDCGQSWYEVFASDGICLADRIGIDRFDYLGASHGAGVGWHLLWKHTKRIKAFIAIVPGPHSVEEGAMSYRQMLLQGIISAPPPFDPPVDQDPVSSV